ncbi:MAG: energy-coupling factor transporter transmembrane component T family protein [Promethearchaeota archaeon]
MSMELLSAFDFIDRDDFVHRLDPRTKLFLVIVYLTLLIMFKQYIVHLILLGNLIIWILLARMGNRVIKSIRGMAFIIFFIIFFNTLFSPNLGLNMGVQMTLRLVNIIIAFSIFFQTTHPDDLTQAIAKMGVSYPIAFSFSLAFRFIPTLANEVETITKAQKSRGLVMQKGGLFQQIRSLFPLLIPLITNSIKRAFYVAESLEARSFGIQKNRTQLHPVRLRFADWAIFVFLLVLLAAGIVAKIYQPQLEVFAIFTFEIPL